MKKIYAKEVSSEYFDAYAYYDEDMAAEDKVSILGNRYYTEVNSSMVEDIKTAMNDCIYDFENTAERREDKLDAIEYEFGCALNKKFTDAQLNEICNIIDEYLSDSNLSESDEICELLGIVYGEKFVRRTIKGNCQGDWNYCYLPEAILDKLSYIEAVYFGTGTELEIAALEDMDGKSNEEIAKAIADSDAHYFDYTELYSPADIKKHIAENEGVSPKDVVILRIAGTRTIITYDYKVAE